MEKSFIVFCISWRVSGREHGIEFHGNKCCVDHCILRRTWMYVYTGKFYYCFAALKFSYERLLSYVKVFTPSREETGTSPSTQNQFDLARLLVQELKELGVKDADEDEHCYVYGHIPATRG